MTNPSAVASRAAPVLASLSGKRLMLLALCAALFLDALDIALVSIALPSIKRELGMTDGALQWILSGYTLGYGGFLLLGGRMADLYGRRKIFLWAMAIFAFASLTGGLVSDPTLLVVTRFVKGLSAAFTAPAALSIITSNFAEGPERNRALSLYTLTGASGFTFGLVVSGLLTQAGWRYVFFVPVPVALLVLALAPFVIPADPTGRRARARFDFAGTITATGGLIALIYGLVRAPELGWGSTEALLPLVGAAALLIAFVLIERVHRAPLVPLGIFRNRTLRTANLVAVLWGTAAFCWMFMCTLYMQETLHYGALAAGAAVLPASLGVVVFSQIAGPLIGRVGLRAVGTIGMILLAVSMAVHLQIGTENAYWTVLMPGMLLHGIAVGLVYPTFTIAGVSGVAERDAGLASGLVTSACQVGIALGAAVSAAVITMVTAGGGEPIAGYRTALVVGIVLCVSGALVAVVGLPGRVRAA